MNRFLTLFSSSSGNCALISNGDTNILIDAGVSASRIVNALKPVGLDICEIDAIAVTHEHSDHIKGIGILSRNYNIPVYASRGTMDAIVASVGDLHDRNIRVVECGKAFAIRSMSVKPFEIPHDAAQPFGYTFDTGNGCVSTATDTGHITKSMLMNMAGSDIVLIEANHDPQMLKNGKYPYPLKKRILSDIGHLSNENAGWLATQLAMWGTKKIVLGHLSEHNNTAEKAYSAVKSRLEENKIYADSDVTLKIAPKTGICMI